MAGPTLANIAGLGPLSGRAKRYIDAAIYRFWIIGIREIEGCEKEVVMDILLLWLWKIGK